MLNGYLFVLPITQKHVLRSLDHPNQFYNTGPSATFTDYEFSMNLPNLTQEVVQIKTRLTFGLEICPNSIYVEIRLG